jgi:hypothetical protein
LELLSIVLFLAAIAVYSYKADHIFAHARAGQAVGQGVEHRIVDAIAGKIVAGIQT